MSADRDRHRQQLLAYLGRADRRLRLDRALDRGVTALAVALIATTLPGILGLADIPSLWALSVAAGLAAAVHGLRGRDLERAAARLDRRAGLNDLLKTALELETKTGPATNPWRPLVLRRACAVARDVPLENATPISRPRSAWLAVLLALTSVSTFWLSRNGALASLRSTLQSPDAEAVIADLPSPSTAAEDPTTATGSQEEPAPPVPPRRQLPQPTRSVTLDESDGTEGVGVPDGEAAQTIAGEEGSLADSEAGGGSEGADQHQVDLVDEQRELLPADDRPFEGAAGEQAGGDSASSAAEHSAGEQEPSMREVSDEVVALDMPGQASPQSDLRRSNDTRAAAAAAADDAATPAGVDAASAELADTPGAPGPSSAPQSSAVDPLGEATELPVTLEEVLLEAGDERDMKPERRRRASRRSEEELSPLRAAARPAAPSGAAPAPSFLEYSARSLAAMRRYFAPDEPPHGSDPQQNTKVPAKTENPDR